jgi:hypothetical protein
MMVAIRATTGPVGLTGQITHLEKRILDRQLLIRHYATACTQDLWNSLTSPSMLLSAGGMGFVVGMLSRRKSSAPHDGLNAEPRAGKRFDDVLKAIALMRTLLPTLRFAAKWLFPQSEASSRGKAEAVDASVVG